MCVPTCTEGGRNENRNHACRSGLANKRGLGTMIVQCSIETEMQENDDGIEVESTLAHCRRCGHTTTSFGTSDASVRRCLVLMRKECPKGQRNFYRRPGWLKIGATAPN